MTAKLPLPKLAEKMSEKLTELRHTENYICPLRGTLCRYVAYDSGAWHNPIDLLRNRKNEDVLIQDGTFSLPGKKALVKSDVEYEVVLIDVTESPVERPKRGSGNGIPGRKSGTH